MNSLDGRPRIIALDFDGCLCSSGAWPGVGEPNWPAIRRAIAAKSDGARLVLNTCRAGDALAAAVEACEAWGIELDAANENLPDIIEFYGGDCRKIYADEYWDDRAVRVAFSP